MKHMAIEKKIIHEFKCESFDYASRFKILSTKNEIYQKNVNVSFLMNIFTSSYYRVFFGLYLL
jgi:hypothetical protein